MPEQLFACALVTFTTTKRTIGAARRQCATHCLRQKSFVGRNDRIWIASTVSDVVERPITSGRGVTSARR